MGQGPLSRDPAFRVDLDEALEAVDAGRGLRWRWLEGSATDLARGCIAQPLLFAFGYATARAVLRHLPESHPVVLVGHSVGELAAATVAGVFDLPLAGALLRRRADLLDTAVKGGMLGCRAPYDRVAEILGAAGIYMDLAAVNVAGQCVVSGFEDDLTAAKALLRDRDVACMRVASTEPFHSPLLAREAQLLGEYLDGFSHLLRPPVRPLMSSWSGSWVTRRDAHDPRFWTRQMAEPVRFDLALAACAERGTLFVEAGPGSTLAVSAAALASSRAGHANVLTTMSRRGDGQEEWDSAVLELTRQASVSSPRIPSSSAFNR